MLKFILVAIRCFLQRRTAGANGAAGAPALPVVEKETNPEQEPVPRLTQLTVSYCEVFRAELAAVLVKVQKSKNVAHQESVTVEDAKSGALGALLVLVPVLAQEVSDREPENVKGIEESALGLQLTTNFAGGQSVE